MSKNYDNSFRLQFMKNGPPKITSHNSPMVYKNVTKNTADELRHLLMDGAKLGDHYGVTGGYEVGEADGYEIMDKHPKINAFSDIYRKAGDTINHGGRRRPSRKYKKSKRVMRRKSRSTRRR